MRSLMTLSLAAILSALPIVACGDHHEGGEAAAEAETIPRTQAPADASVYIISPADGAEIGSPLTVRFGLRGMGVAPAGVPSPATGHHHLIIDADTPSANAAIPADAGHIHFGKGQTETSVELAPGEHTLQLVLGDMNHVPHDPPVVSKRITIVVK